MIYARITISDRDLPSSLFELVKNNQGKLVWSPISGINVSKNNLIYNVKKEISDRDTTEEEITPFFWKLKKMIPFRMMHQYKFYEEDLECLVE